jgi:hypothetical protein
MFLCTPVVLGGLLLPAAQVGDERPEYQCNAYDCDHRRVDAATRGPEWVGVVGPLGACGVNHADEADQR